MEIVFVVTQSSILRPPLFKIFLANLFFIISNRDIGSYADDRPPLFKIFLANLFFIISNRDIASYADDNTPYIAAGKADDFTKSLEEVSTAFFQWFENNLLKNNPDMCHLLITSNENTTDKIGEYEIENSDCEKLL